MDVTDAVKMETDTNKKYIRKRNVSCMNFIKKLAKIVDYCVEKNMGEWITDGKIFQVYDKVMFVKYLGSYKYATFLRQLNHYKFSFYCGGQQSFWFAHELFTAHSYKDAWSKMKRNVKQSYKIGSKGFEISETKKQETTEISVEVVGEKTKYLSKRQITIHLKKDLKNIFLEIKHILASKRNNMKKQMMIIRNKIDDLIKKNDIEWIFYEDKYYPIPINKYDFETLNKYYLEVVGQYTYKDPNTFDYSKVYFVQFDDDTFDVGRICKIANMVDECGLPYINIEFDGKIYPKILNEKNCGNNVRRMFELLDSEKMYEDISPLSADELIEYE